MCATGIKHSYVLYHSSFSWYLHEHRHVHSLKIRQCATHSVDNSTERARERGVGAYWKLQLERGQFLHLLIAKLKIGNDFKNNWWTKNMNRSHPHPKKIKTRKNKMSVYTHRKCSFFMTLNESYWVKTVKIKLSATNVFKNISLSPLLKNTKMAFWQIGHNHQ